MRHGRARKQLDRRIVVDFVALQHAAMPVARVLAQAYVGDAIQLGIAFLGKAHRALHDAVFSVCRRCDFVFHIRDAEQHVARHTRSRKLLELLGEAVE